MTHKPSLRKCSECEHPLRFAIYDPATGQRTEVKYAASECPHNYVVGVYGHCLRCGTHIVEVPQ